MPVQQDRTLYNLIIEARKETFGVSLDCSGPAPRDGPVALYDKSRSGDVQDDDQG
jgi:hypothetical protein